MSYKYDRFYTFGELNDLSHSELLDNLVYMRYQTACSEADIEAFNEKINRVKNSAKLRIQLKMLEAQYKILTSYIEFLDLYAMEYMKNGLEIIERSVGLSRNDYYVENLMGGL